MHVCASTCGCGWSQRRVLGIVPQELLTSLTRICHLPELDSEARPRDVPGSASPAQRLQACHLTWLFKAASKVLVLARPIFQSLSQLTSPHLFLFLSVATSQQATERSLFRYAFPHRCQVPCVCFLLYLCFLSPAHCLIENALTGS